MAQKTPQRAPTLPAVLTDEQVQEFGLRVQGGVAVHPESGSRRYKCQGCSKWNVLLKDNLCAPCFKARKAA